MKRTRLTAMFLALVLAISSIASMGVLTVSAQEISTDVSEVGGSAFGDTKATYVVTLYWDDNDNAYGTRPEEVTVLITANNGEFGSDYLYLNEDNHWENVKSGLPVFYFKGSRSGMIHYDYEVVDLPECYDISIVQEGNWFKVTCSLKKSDIALTGDVDGDNVISVTDATIIQRYDVGYKVKANNINAGDVNCDQHVDILDASIVQRYISGLDCSHFNVGK
jgi:hypothetical protein